MNKDLGPEWDDFEVPMPSQGKLAREARRLAIEDFNRVLDRTKKNLALGDCLGVPDDDSE